MRWYMIRYRYCFVLAIIVLLITVSSSPTQAAGPASPYSSLQTAATAGAECDMGPPSYTFRGVSQNVVIDGEFNYPYCDKWKYSQATRVPSYCYYSGDYEARLSSTTRRQTVYQDITVPANAPGGSRDLGVIIFLKNVPPDAHGWDNIKVTIQELSTGFGETLLEIHPVLGGYTSCALISLPVQNDYRGKTIRLKFESTLYVPGYDIRIDAVSLWFNSW